MLSQLCFNSVATKLQLYPTQSELLRNLPFSHDFQFRTLKPVSVKFELT
jgi:hypothetical protein